MLRYGKTIRSLAAGFAGFLLTFVVWAQDGGAGTNIAGGSATIEVKGILISPRSRSALINGRLFRVGDQVSGVEIIGIDHREVRLRDGSREAGVPVGASRSMDRLHWSPATPALTQPTEVQVATVVEVSPEPVHEPVQIVTQEPTQESTQSKDLPQQHAVRPGETLSEIAETYLVPGVRRYQLMVALFEANPQAFHGNINRMRAGVVLNIPGSESLVSTPSKLAMAKVMEQTDQWRSKRPRQTEAAQPVVADTYGPVSSGETLSLIAHRLLQNGGDTETLMSALYRANPHAFGNNMNMLREGAVLRIPDPFEGMPQETGTVVAHMSPN